MLRQGLIAIVVGVTLTVSATAEARPPLRFAERTALSVSCAELVEGQSVAIRNETAVRRRVRLILSGLENADGQAVGARRVCGGLRVKMPVEALGPGQSTKASLRASSSGPQSYSGSLVLFAPRKPNAGQGGPRPAGRVARRSLSISPTPEAEFSATPLVASQSVEREARKPSGDEVVWLPVAGASEDIPEPPVGTDGSGSATVGVLSGVDDTLAVTYEGEKRALTETTSLVGLELGDDYEPGSYSGKVDLTPGAEGGEVTVNLEVTTWWPIPALMLLLGIAGGVLLQRQSGRDGPRARLLQRIDELSSRRDDAAAKLQAAGGAKPWGAFGVAHLDELQAKLREQVERSTKKAWIQVDKAVLTDLEARIAVVEGQIDLLEMIPDRSRELEVALADLESERPSELPELRGSDAEQTSPRLVGVANGALDGGDVGAGELQGKVDAIGSQTAAVRSLQRLERRLHDLWKAKLELEGSLSKAELDELEEDLTATRHLLWRAESSEELESAAKEIEETAKEVARLWHKLPGEAPELLAMIRGARHAHLELATYASIGVPAPGAIAEGLPPTPPAPAPVPVKPLPQLSAEEAETQISKARFGQGMLVLVTGAVALASGLAALYVGKPWGSDWDYLAALVWGLAGQTLVLSLATSLDGLGALAGRRVRR